MRRRGRGDSLGSLLGQWAKSCLNAKSGKIYKCSTSGWILGDGSYTTQGGYTFLPRPDDDGRMMSLKPGSFVLNCPEPPKGHDATARTESGYWVPIRQCGKCPHRLPNFCCEVLKAKAGNPEVEMAKAIGEAVQKAKEMIS